MSNFDFAFEKLMENEGGYVNHPNDPGGETNWGITIKVARENGYFGKMKDLTQSEAKDIYRKNYWISDFDNIPYMIAFNAFDCAVNSGINQSVKWLQRSIGQKDDGIFGTKTLGMIKNINEEAAFEVCTGFNAERLLFYTNLNSWTTFGKGWARRIANNLAYLSNFK